MCIQTYTIICVYAYIGTLIRSMFVLFSLNLSSLFSNTKTTLSNYKNKDSLIFAQKNYSSKFYMPFFRL